MKELIGCTIQEIWIDKGREGIMFKVLNSKGSVTYRNYQTENDCCNTVWFSDIYGVDALIGAQVYEVEDTHTDDSIGGNKFPDPPGIFDVLDTYSVKIRTNKGYADIVYRNDHNGYYGGSCSYTGSQNHYQSYVNSGEQITKDFTA